MQSLRELVLCRAAEMCGEDAKGAECGPKGSIAGGGGIEGAVAEGNGTEDCEPYLSGRDNGNGGGTHGVGDSEGGARLSEPLLGRLQDPRTEQWQMDDVAAQETAEAAAEAVAAAALAVTSAGEAENEHDDDVGGEDPAEAADDAEVEDDDENEDMKSCPDEGADEPSGAGNQNEATARSGGKGK